MTLRPGITITLAERADAPFCIEYRSASQIAGVLVGKPAGQVPDLLGSLFAICPSAQKLAASLAISAENETTLSDLQFAEMARKVRFETIREHGVRILLDWSQALGEEPARSDIAALIVLAKAMNGGELAAFIEEKILGRDCAGWLAIEDLKSLREWAGGTQSVAARYILHSLDAQNVPLASGQSQPLMVQRYLYHPLIQALADDPVTACHVARLIDLATLGFECDLGVLKLLPPSSAKARSVACSRGDLVHHARLENGAIASYQICSPTDTLFASGGLGEHWLNRIPQSVPERRMDDAKRVMQALDPCVEYAIEMR